MDPQDLLNSTGHDATSPHTGLDINYQDCINHNYPTDAGVVLDNGMNLANQGLDSMTLNYDGTDLSYASMVETGADGGFSLNMDCGGNDPSYASMTETGADGGFSLGMDYGGSDPSYASMAGTGADGGFSLGMDYGGSDPSYASMAEADMNFGVNASIDRSSMDFIAAPRSTTPDYEAAAYNERQAKIKADEAASWANSGYLDKAAEYAKEADQYRSKAAENLNP
jgi:hypothetical protein